MKITIVALVLSLLSASPSAAFLPSVGKLVKNTKSCDKSCCKSENQTSIPQAKAKGWIEKPERKPQPTAQRPNGQPSQTTDQKKQGRTSGEVDLSR